MFAYFQRLPSIFGGRIIGQLYFGAYAKVLFDPKNESAKVLFFGGEKVCHSPSELEREVADILRKRNCR